MWCLTNHVWCAISRKVILLRADVTAARPLIYPCNEPWRSKQTPPVLTNQVEKRVVLPGTSWWRIKWQAIFRLALTHWSLGYFKGWIFKIIIQHSSLGTWRVSALRWVPQNLINEKSTLLQVMAWCRQAASHCLSQYWPVLCRYMASLYHNKIQNKIKIQLILAGSKQGQLCYIFIGEISSLRNWKVNDVIVPKMTHTDAIGDENFVEMRNCRLSVGFIFFNVSRLSQVSSLRYEHNTTLEANQIYPTMAHDTFKWISLVEYMRSRSFFREKYSLNPSHHLY